MQAQLSRRKVLTSAAFLASYPAAGALASAAGVGQATTTSLPTRPTAVPTLSVDLAEWTNSKVAPVGRHLRSGGLEPHHLRAAGSSVRAYARHLEDIEIDQYANIFAALLTTQKPGLADTETIRMTHEHLSQYDRALPYEEIERVHTLTVHGIAGGAKSLQKNGYSWHFHYAADRLHRAADVLEWQHTPHATPADLRSHGMHGHLSDGIYHPGAGAHLELENGRICRFMKKYTKNLSDKTRDELCSDLTDAAIVQAVIGLGAVGLCATAYGLTLVATDGAVLAVVSPIAASALCRMAGVLTGAAVTAVMAAAACALSC